MSSLLPGFEYDIFISYRQKDNKYDAWVTEFVTNLKKELEATFKDDISIYFDSDVNNGLLENHNVDKSLESKLNCLIFIPIISQTYCDPKSFAWQHELMAFNRMAKEDLLGRDITIANGNVTSRILPVKIHDLDNEDKVLLENELGGVLRSIDFIYKSSGVNRPLKPNDDKSGNINHTYYRDQINKVANAVKEIITAIKQSKQKVREITIGSAIPSKQKFLSGNKIAVGAIAFIVLCAAIYGIATFLNQNKKEEEVKIDRSIAVLPFANMSADKSQDYFSDGLSEELLNLLAKIPELKVISRTSAFSFKGKNEDIRTIGDKLDVAYLLEGSVRKAEDKVRITAQLIKARDGSHLWSETFDRDMNDIFKVQDEIAGAVVKQLKIKLLGSDRSLPRESKPEVYNLWLQSKFFLNLETEADIEKALGLITRAKALDSTDARVWSVLATIYYLKSIDSKTSIEISQWAEKSRAAAKTAITFDKNLPDPYEVLSSLSLVTEWDLKAAESFLHQALEIDPSNAASINSLGTVIRDLGRYQEAIELYKKSIDLDPLRPASFFNLSLVHAYLGDYKEAIEQIKRALDITPRPVYHSILGITYTLNGEPQQAIAEGEKCTDEFWKAYCLAPSFWSNGRKPESDAMLKTLIEKYGETGAFQIAEIYAWRGEKKKAFEWLDRAYHQRDQGLIEIKSSFFVKSLKQDPRYEALLVKLKLSL
jgi:adenylate cyclase